MGRRLWQPGYFDRVLRGEETTEACALYIFNNPVRAKLAATIFEYPFSGGSWFDKLLAESSPSTELKLGATGSSTELKLGATDHRSS